MKLISKQKLSCDVLVIGSGGAGLRAAIAASLAGADVAMVSKAKIGHATNTILSKAIIASSGWGTPDDTSEVHGKDTIEGGRYLNNPDMVKQFAQAIHPETQLLREWGVGFGLDADNHPMVLKIPGHSHARHLFGRNWKGSDLVFPLKQKAKACNVKFLEHWFVTSLLTSEGRVCGASCISKDGGFRTIQSRAVVLATGGFGHVFLNTNNAPGITGDGLALASETGAVLQDMEFVQFYPTAMGRHGNRILLNERLIVQEGVSIQNNQGENILIKNGYTAPGDVTRDELAQVIMKEILNDPDQDSGVIFDLSGLSEEAAKELAALLPAGWKKGQRQFKVSPTTHFCMGGLVVDTQGESSCRGLFAAGEVTAGAHGANRLGGNALAEVIAMGGRVGKKAAVFAETSGTAVEIDELSDIEKQRLESLDGEGKPVKEMIQTLKQTMWLNAGIIRDDMSLEAALAQIQSLEAAPVQVNNAADLITCLEFKNMVLVARSVCLSALERKESRGSHFRTDFSTENDQDWLQNIQIKKTGDRLTLKTIPVHKS